RQPFDHAGLDIFEDVSAEAVERVGLAVVADDQQIVGRRYGRDAPAAARKSRCDRNREDEDETAGERHGQIRAMSGTGMAPNDSSRSWKHFSENDAPSIRSRSRRSWCNPSVPSQYMTAVPGNIEFLQTSARAASGGMPTRSR